ncbi:hypothetical protein AB9F29_12195 [Falsihalocynthiibacter sp. S25ZX9]
MSNFAAIICKFPEYERAIQQLCAENESLGSACMDFEEATAAFHHWRKVENDGLNRAQEYHRIMDELEAEIRSVLQSKIVGFK